MTRKTLAGVDTYKQIIGKVNMFSLEYLDWCKANKGVTKIEETYRDDWVREFYESKEWDKKPVNGIEYGLATGRLK